MHVTCAYMHVTCACIAHEAVMHLHACTIMHAKCSLHMYMHVICACRTAPEAMTHAQFSSASDVWSYGVTLWEIYSIGNVPWKGLSPIEIRDILMEGQRLGRPERCPADVFDVMRACWKDNPQKRPTFADIMRRIKVVRIFLVPPLLPPLPVFMVGKVLFVLGQ